MRLADVNLLVCAFREAAPGHSRYRKWLEAMIASHEAFAISDDVLAGFLQLATDPRIFDPPAPVDAALQFAESLRSRPNAVHIAPGARHWDIFTRLCQECDAKGNLIPAAWLAALAIEHGCELITTDRDFARFPDLRWRHPLKAG